MTVLPGYFALPKMSKALMIKIRAHASTSVQRVLFKRAANLYSNLNTQPRQGVIASVRAQSGQRQAAAQAAVQALTLDANNANAAWVLLQALQVKGNKAQVFAPR